MLTVTLLKWGEQKIIFTYLKVAPESKIAPYFILLKIQIQRQSKKLVLLFFRS